VCDTIKYGLIAVLTKHQFICIYDRKLYEMTVYVIVYSQYRGYNHFPWSDSDTNDCEKSEDTTENDTDNEGSIHADDDE
jgi:hypothetical protein